MNSLLFASIKMVFPLYVLLMKCEMKPWPSVFSLFFLSHNTMLHSKTILKKTKSNKVVKVVREVYLRDDIYCCSLACGKCPFSPASKLEADVPEYIVIDTNVVLHQIDLLEHLGIKNVIVLETVLEETKNRSMHTYTRLREITSDKARSFVVFSNEKHKYDSCFHLIFIKCSLLNSIHYNCCLDYIQFVLMFFERINLVNLFMI